MEDEELEEKKKGLWGTILFHAGILAILLHFGVVTPMKTPQDVTSVEVNFGDSENGLGAEEPAGGGMNQTLSEKQKEPLPQQAANSADKEDNVVPSIAKVKKVSAVKQAVTPSYKPVVTKVREKVLTQNTQEAPAVAQTWKQRKEQEKLEREQEKQEREQALQRQKDYLARKKAEEQAAIRAAAQQRFTSQSRSLAAAAFGRGSGGGTGDGRTNGHGIGTGKSHSQGITFPGGNQGIPSGKTGSKNYGRIGGPGKGVSYSLAGRRSLALPKPLYPGNEEGVVVVQVTVDQEGTVKKAVPGVRGSTTMNSELLSAAHRAALKAHFNIDNDAPAFQQGTITYRFILE